MNLICGCGNKVKFNIIEEESYVEDEHGQYATIDKSKFTIWQEHDIVGLSCKKCGKAVWMFV